MTWKVSDVMTHDVVTVGPSASFKTCANLMRIHGVSALPVVAGDRRIVGILSEDDLMRKVAHQPDPSGGQAPIYGKESALDASDLMTTNVAVIEGDAPVAAAARLMFQRHVKRLPVVDASNRLTGIVSRSDVLRVFLRSDESIRKEIDNDLLHGMPLISRGPAHAEVRDGVVHLYGEIEAGTLRGLLVRLAQGVPGVVGVQDHMRPASPGRELVGAGSVERGWRDE